MVLETRLIRSLALAASAAWLALALPGSAKADDWWNSVLGFVGMGPHKPTDDAIDYTARPALVVPPKMDLPPPQTAVARPSDWPNDPDAAARHRAEADSRRPAPPAPPDASGTDSDQPDQPDPAAAPAAPAVEPVESDLAGDKQVAVPWNAAQTSGVAPTGKRVYAPFGGHGGATSLSAPQQNCNQFAGVPLCLGSWDWFGLAKSDDAKAARTLRVGVEPPREYLTQPPPGYRAPVAVDGDNSAQNAVVPAPPAAPASTPSDKNIGR